MVGEGDDGVAHGQVKGIGFQKEPEGGFWVKGTIKGGSKIGVNEDRVEECVYSSIWDIDTGSVLNVGGRVARGI